MAGRDGQAIQSHHLPRRTVSKGAGVAYPVGKSPEEFIGYYTDGNLKNDADAKTYAHAQYVLAPTIVEFMNLNHKYILFVCSSDSAALKKIQEIGAVPLRQNRFGMILAERNL